MHLAAVTSGSVSVARRCPRRRLCRRQRLQRPVGPVSGWIRLWVRQTVDFRPTGASVSRRHLRRLLFRRPRRQRRVGLVSGWIRLWVRARVDLRPTWASVSRRCLRHPRRRRLRGRPGQTWASASNARITRHGPRPKVLGPCLSASALTGSHSHRHSPLIKWVGAQLITSI